MIETAVSNLERIGGARLLAGDAGRICRGCAIDSRQVTPDAIFVAFPGERVDGNDYARPAIEAGAAAVVMTREPEDGLVAFAGERGCALALTDDPTEFLLRLAADYRERLGCLVIGITGSIGKTTTKDALASLLSARYRVHVTSGNHNNLIGLPLTVLSAPADTQVLVLEMGMDGFGQIERLSACARPTYAVITKIGTSHIGLLGSRENIARAKAEIVSGMAPAPAGAAAAPERPLLVLNGEDDFTPFIADTFAAPAGVEVLTCGVGEGDDVRISDVRVAADGCPSFTLDFGDGVSLSARLGVPGAQSVVNAAFAAALAHRLGIGAQDIADRLAALSITGRRTEVRTAACGARIIDDSYNAAPESMAAGLDLLAKLPCEGRRIAVLGEMGELGDEGARLHELTGAYAAAKKLDLLVCVGGENARRMASAARLMGMPEDAVCVVDDTDAAIARFAHALSAGDLALVKGSRFVGLDRFVEEV